jgi:hypothetical protein
MANSDLKIRTKDYALSVIRLFAELPKRTEAQIIGRQAGRFDVHESRSRSRFPNTNGLNASTYSGQPNGTAVSLMIHEHEHGIFPSRARLFSNPTNTSLSDMLNLEQALSFRRQNPHDHRSNNSIFSNLLD